jgi:4-oxalmesaconate hydratase
VIIDSHAHLVAPPSLYAYRASLSVSGIQHGNHLGEVSDDDLAKSAASNVAIMDAVGTDIQCISPRPFMQMHRGPQAQSQLWARTNNETIARTIKLHPTRFRGVAALPQVAGEPIEGIFAEIDYAVEKLGFIGILLNPDPGEGVYPSPPLADKYWHPLYEKLVAMDLPMHVHSGGCSGRETYDEHFVTEESLAITSIARSDVFDRFPKLRIMISHGGGSIPYQIGRWQSNRQLQTKKDQTIAGMEFQGKSTSAGTAVIKHSVKDELFEVTLRRFYFDTCLHYKPSLELLLGLVGSDRVLFGTERPGSGSGIDPNTGRGYDDLKPVLESISSLGPADLKKIFEENSQSFFGSRLKLPAKAAAGA